MSALPSLEQFAAWLATVERASTKPEADLARSNILAAYGRAYGRDAGLNEAATLVAALKAAQTPARRAALKAVVAEVEAELRDASDEAARDSLVPWGRDV